MNLQNLNFQNVKQRALQVTQNIKEDVRRIAQEKGFIRTVFGSTLPEVLQFQLALQYTEPVPRILIRAIDYIEKNLETGIYRLSGSTREIMELKQKYERDLDIHFQYEDVHSVTSLLKQFIRELPEPLLTNRLGPQFDKILNKYSDVSYSDDINLQSHHILVRNEVILQPLRELISLLPIENRDFLGIFLSHLKRIAELREYKMGYSNLQVVFAPTIHFGGSLFLVLVLHSELLFPTTDYRKYLMSRRRPSEPAYQFRAPEIDVPRRLDSKNLLQTSPIKKVDEVVSPPPRNDSIGLLKPQIPPRPTLRPDPIDEITSAKSEDLSSTKRESTMKSHSAGPRYPSLQYENPSDNPFDDPPPVPEKELPQIPVYSVEQIKLLPLPTIEQISPFPDFEEVVVNPQVPKPPEKPPRRRNK